MRRWHRWAAIPAAVFLLFISTTGILLHLDMIRTGQMPPGPGDIPTPVSGPLPSNEELTEMIVKLADGVRATPGAPSSQLQINLSGPGAILIASDGGPPGVGTQIKFDAQSGERIIDPPRPADYHYVLQELHAGNSFGWTGRIISILCGLALMTLCVTGLQVWWEMRVRGKKRGLYWK